MSKGWRRRICKFAGTCGRAAKTGGVNIAGGGRDSLAFETKALGLPPALARHQMGTDFLKDPIVCHLFPPKIHPDFHLRRRYTPNDRRFIIAVARVATHLIDSVLYALI